ncbi:hypothetical protein ASD67_17025 [Sphingopyxis sp. Root1497]|nr:hypothetical protein ASD67_17025 [Sphingopyxis sp. Root1497]
MGIERSGLSRRAMIAQGAALLALLPACTRAAEPAPAPRWQPEEAKAIEAIPYERIEVPGAQAMARWDALRTARPDVWPVIVGGDEDLARIADQMAMTDLPPAATTLAAAAKLAHPKSLWDLRDKEKADWHGYLKAHPELGPEDEDYVADLGDWPAVPPQETGLTVAEDILTRRPYPHAHILLLPTVQSFEVPAYLKWGGWNACPPPEIHVAAMRRWGEDYGAEIVGITGDVINMRVKRRPATREEAISLAREQYAYCADIVDQGVEDIATLAAGLMASDWWYFWWD